MKVIFSTILSLILSLQVLTAAPQVPDTDQVQQATIDSAMKQLSESIGNLTRAMELLDSANIPDIPAFIDLEDLQKEIENFQQDIKDDSIDLSQLKIEQGSIYAEGIATNDDEEDDDNDTDKLKNVKTVFLGLDMGINAYLDNNNKIDVPAAYAPLELNLGKSINVNLHIVHQNINLVRHVLNLDYGLYAEINNYRFASDATLIPRADTIGFSLESTPLKKNKLTCTYLTIPLTLDIETNPNKKSRSFSIRAGGFAGLLVGAHSKQVNPEGEKLKIRDDYSLNKIRYGLTARVGYGDFNLYVNYTLSNMFNDGVQPELNPVAIGLGLWF